MKIDDSALLHGRAYDPAKAHEYYLRTRHLKGAKGSSTPAQGLRKTAKVVSITPHLQKSRREQLVAERQALEKRLGILQAILEEKVDAAKRRSGVKIPPKDTETSSVTSTTTKKDGKDDAPLSEEQKRKKREAAKEQYEKEKRMPVSMQVAELHARIRDIRAKIEKAVADARRQHAHSNPQTAPKGR